MDVNDMNMNSVVACSPLSIRDYSPSPSTTNNNTPSTSNTSNKTPTPNRTPNPITTTLPNTTHRIKMESHGNVLHHPTHPTITYNNNIQPLLTSMNDNINNNISSSRSIPRIPLPNMMPKFTMNHNLSLPPLPKEFLNKNNKCNNKKKHKLKLKPSEQNKNNKPIKMEIDIPNENRDRDSISTSLSSSPEEYSIIRSAFNHNLRVKQEHLHEEPILDTSFDNCYIFSMRCPYADCCKLFNDMLTYQNHHISKHQLRDKKGKLIQSKEAKWTCPECGKISASWYNYAAHVTMHKDSCDAPWICKLPPMNKKKYIKWTDGTLICGKRCSTKHNLIKHLKALHTNHRIIDLSQSVKAQSIKSTEGYNRRISPRKNKKRPRFTNTNIISPIDNGIVNVIKHNSYHNKHNSVPITQPPKKKIKMDPDAMNTNINASSVPTALPIYSTGDNFVNHSNKRKKKKKQKKKSKKKTKKRQSVQQQGDFVGLLLEAAQLIDTEPYSPKSKYNKQPLSATSSNTSIPITIENINQLLNSIKTIFNSTANSLSKPISLDNFSELSAVLAVAAAANMNKEETDNDNTNININNSNVNINISNITDMSSISIPQIQSKIYNKNINNKRIMPDINIMSNMPTICNDISPITATNPAISLPKLPLPPPPPENMNNISENGLEALLRILNKKSNTLSTVIPIHNYAPPQIPNIMVNTNTFNTFNNFPLPLLPNLNETNNNTTNVNNNNSYLPNQKNILTITQSPTRKSKNMKNNENNSVISNNILSSLPPIIMDSQQKSA